MTAISNSVKSCVKPVALFFIENKEDVKKVSAVFANAFAFISIVQVCNAFKHRTSISNQISKIDITFKGCAYKSMLWISHGSLILNGLTVAVGPVLVGSVAKRLFSAKRLDAWCGPNINFAGNSRHPRHLASLAAFVLALPGMIYSVCALSKWTWSVISFKKNSKNSDEVIEENTTNYNRIPDNWILTGLVLATVFGRPAFHIGHSLARKFFHIP